MTLLAGHLKGRNECSKDVKAMQQRLRDKLLILSEAMTNCNDKNALQQLEVQINSAKHLFTSLQNRTPLRQLQVSKQYPANKRIETQHRFYSTKKKRKNTQRLRFSKPTRNETDKILKKKTGISRVSMSAFITIRGFHVTI